MGSALTPDFAYPCRAHVRRNDGQGLLRLFAAASWQQNPGSNGQMIFSGKKGRGQSHYADRPPQQPAPKWQSASSAKKIQAAHLSLIARPGLFRVLASHLF
jgi:hypothetical protein